MGEIFITLNEASVFEGIDYDTMKKRVQRNKFKFDTKIESSNAGGRDRLLININSLSLKAKRGYKEKLKVDIKDVSTDKRASEESMPWYIYVDLESYIENNKKHYYKAVELGNQIEKFINNEDRDRTSYASEFAASLGISQRTLYRYSKAYLEGQAWAIKFEMYDKRNYDFFKTLSLCRKPKESHTFPSMSFEIKTIVENIWFDKDFARNAGTKEMLYSKLSEISEENGWEYPSYQTIARYISYLMEKDANAHFLAANGLREFKNKKMVKASRDTKALPVMGLVQGDEHTFDCWVKYTAPNGKVKAIKPKLVAWMDTRSRTILGDVLCLNANSQILKQSLFKMMYSTPGGIPKWLLIDNGKDYTAETMTGRKRNDRVSFDSETKGFYRSIGIEDDMRSIPYQPWSKAQIERFFGTVCSKFTKWMTSYTGTLTGSRTAGKIKKDIPKMLEKDQLLTLEEFYELWTKWKDEVYHQSQHSGLKRSKEKYITPLDLFMNAEDKYYKPAPPKSYATMLMMKAQRVHVYNIGIKKFGNEYRALELTDYIDKKVDIRWDAEDVTRLYVYNLNGEKICEAVSQELLQIAPKMSQKALEEHLKMQNNQIKNARAKNAEYTTPLEERNEMYSNAPAEASIGIEDLMTGVKESSSSNNVVALVNDKQYKEEIKSNKKKAYNTGNSEFLNKKAQEALSALRNLG